MEDKMDRIRMNALELIYTHKKDPIIFQVDSDVWKVKQYDVLFDFNSGWYCKCRWHEFKGECKHIIAIKICKEEKIYIPLYQIG